MTIDDLPKTKDPQDDWREFYVEHGKEMIALAEHALTSKDDALIGKGLQIVCGAYFEEDDENRESAPALAALDFSPLIPALVSLLAQPAFAARALYGLWVCCEEGAPAKGIDRKAVEPWMDKAKGKEKISGVAQPMTVRAAAFRVIVHILGQEKHMDEVARMVDGNVDLKKVLNDELGLYRARDYDRTPFTKGISADLRAKGEAKVFRAVKSLWASLSSGADISADIPYLVENQKRLAMFTDVLKVIAGYYLVSGKHKELEIWLSDADGDASLRAARGLYLSLQDGVGKKEFNKDPAMKEKLSALAEKAGFSLKELGK